MMYQNYPYRIFNPAYLSAYQAQQREAQRQWEQNKNIVDLKNAFSDFLDALGNVHPDFQQMAENACFFAIVEHMAKNGGGRR